MGRVRQGNRWDAVINSVNYRLKRDAERPYQKFTARSLLELQQLLNQESGQFTSRSDVRPLFQTAWGAGAQWQKPLLSEQSIDSYYESLGMDFIGEPGNMKPQASQTNTTPTGVDGWAKAVFVSHEEIYYDGDNGGSGNTRLFKWDGSAFSALTNRWQNNNGIRTMCWDAANNTVFGYDGSDIMYITPDSANGSVIAAISTTYPGAVLFMHFGRLMWYDGDALYEIEDPLGSPTQTKIFDDGMGVDMLNEADFTTGTQVFWQTDVQLATPSSEGIWLIKNTPHPGGILPLIYRIDRTNDGIDVGTPVGSLPVNSVALNMTYHLGSLIVATASDMYLVMANQVAEGFPPATFFHLTNNSLGTIGQIGDNSPSETVFKFLAADREKLYLGGRESIWVYDAVRGGFHQWAQPKGGGSGSLQSMVWTTDAAGDRVQLLNSSAAGDDTKHWITLEDEADGADSHYVDSNYFDGNLPAEKKTIVGVTLMTDGISTNENWTVQFDTDDGGLTGYGLAWDSTDDNTSYKELNSNAAFGYRFTFRLQYTVTGSGVIATPSRVKGIIVHMVQGELVTGWRLVLDGSHMSNVENQKQEPDTVLTNLESLAGTQTVIPYVDEFKLTSSSHDVRVQNVQIDRQNPQEIEQATVVLFEHNLDN